MLPPPQVLGLTLVPGSLQEIESLESVILKLPQAKYRLRTFHAPGVYLREIWMPRGAFIIGHEHRTEHFNIVAKGAALVVVNGHVERMQAPYCLVSCVGVRKILLILEDMVWYTVHPNPQNIRDEDVLEEMMIVKSRTWLDHEVCKAERLLQKLDHVLPDFSQPSQLQP